MGVLYLMYLFHVSSWPQSSICLEIPPIIIHIPKPSKPVSESIYFWFISLCSAVKVLTTLNSFLCVDCHFTFTPHINYITECCDFSASFSKGPSLFSVGVRQGDSFCHLPRYHSLNHALYRPCGTSELFNSAAGRLQLLQNADPHCIRLTAIDVNLSCTKSVPCSQWLTLM